jgi:hypothetical protein
MTRSSIIAGLAIVAVTAGTAAAAELKIEQATIANGKLVVTGRTTKPNQMVELVNTGDKTVSLPSRKFSFSLTYIPNDCTLHLRSNGEDFDNVSVTKCERQPKDGAKGQDGKDGKDGKDGFTYGSLPGDGVIFRCWPSDLIGLWFIRDYPAPNSRTIAHIAPDRVAGGNKMTLTEPSDPIKTAKPEGAEVTRVAEFDKDKLYILNPETKGRIGMRGDLSPDCKSIVWRGQGDSVLNTWVR